MDDKERRKRLGLDQYDNETLEQLRKRSSYKTTAADQSHESSKELFKVNKIQ